MNKILIYIVLNLILLHSFSCRNDRKLDVVLPAYETKPMVECYLIPGENYKLLLTQSVPILAQLIAIPINNAVVTIQHLNRTDTLFPNPSIVDPKDTTKIYNYYNYDYTIPEDYENDFKLEIKTPAGLKITSKTKISKPAQIDSAKVNFDNNTRWISLYINDNQMTEKHYRIMVFQENNRGLQTQTLITDNQNKRFSPFLFYNSNQLIFNSKNDFFINEKGDVFDSVAVRTLSIQKDYYEFLQSVRDVQNSNNPFAQPASIKSNVSNGVGIFTGFKPIVSLIPVPQ
jgi:hypothetical protein